MIEPTLRRHRIVRIYAASDGLRHLTTIHHSAAKASSMARYVRLFPNTRLVIAEPASGPSPDGTAALLLAP